jgi:uncharacterized delta-60 repeat protein
MSDLNETIVDGVGVRSRTPASPPEIRRVTRPTGQIVASLLGPANTGGAPVTGYKYSTDNGATWATLTTAADADSGWPTRSNGATFSSSDAGVQTFTIAADGSVFVAGSFPVFDNLAMSRVVRLTEDGTPDQGFNPPVVSDAVNALAVQSDGKVVIGGDFTAVGGVAQNRIARLNTDGTRDTGFNTGGTVGVNGTVRAVAVQSDGKIVIGGGFTTARGTTQNRIARLNTDGSLDTGFNTGGTVGVNGTVRLIAIQPDGKIVIAGDFTTARGTAQNYIARLETDGTLDTGFNIPADGTVGVGSLVFSLHLGSDGKILVGGDFTTARGVARSRIARLNADGSLDATFDPPTVNGTVSAISVRSDDKILVGGSFTTIGGVTVNRIALLNDDGSRVTTFNTGGVVGAGDPVRRVAQHPNGRNLVGGAFYLMRGLHVGGFCALTDSAGEVDAGFRNPGVAHGVLPGNNSLYAAEVDGQGRIVIGGNFSTYAGVTKNNFVRLNADQTVDDTFNVGGTIGAGSAVVSLAIQPDGKIVIGGWFFSVRNVTQNRIARLNTDGTLDTEFNTGGTVGVNSDVEAVALQSDGKIIIGGWFTAARGTTQNYIARLNADGTLDTSFNAGDDIGTNSVVYDIAIQSDGKIVIGGAFAAARGVTQNYIARLNADGSLDTGFNVIADGTIGVNNSVRSVAIQPDGKIIIVGDFTTARGVTQNRIARLNTDGSLDTGFNTGGTVGADNSVRAVLLQPDGTMFITGTFTTVRGTAQNRIGFLAPDGSRIPMPSTLGNIGTATGLFLAPYPGGRALVGGQNLLSFGGRAWHSLGLLNPTETCTITETSDT